MDFAVPVDHRVKIKRKWELKKKLWNMKVTFIPIVIGTLSTYIEGLLKGLEDLEIRG